MSLTENEKIFISYIKENPEAFVKMTSAEISEASFISNATIYHSKKMDLLTFRIEDSGFGLGRRLSARTENAGFQLSDPHQRNPILQITRTMQELYEQTVVSAPQPDLASGGRRLP